MIAMAWFPHTRGDPGVEKSVVEFKKLIKGVDLNIEKTQAWLAWH